MTVETAVSQPEKGTSTELGGSSQFVEAAVTCSINNSLLEEYFSSDNQTTGSTITTRFKSFSVVLNQIYL